MARVTAVFLRARAREALLACGARGFMRFAQEGGALLVTDAIRRCADETERTRLTAALCAAGFVCCEQGGLLALTPLDDMLGVTDCPGAEIDWESELHPAQALAARWLAAQRRPLTQAGRQLIIETLRLTWQTKDKVLAGLVQLRAQAAVLQRTGDTSGLYEAGAVVYQWCETIQGGCDDED